MSCINVKLVTFASPRVFGTRSAEKVSKFLGEDNIIRIWGSYDPISSVAPGFSGFKHIGRSGGYQMQNSSWVWSKSATAIHAMRNYKSEIENSTNLSEYESPWWTGGQVVNAVKRACQYYLS